PFRSSRLIGAERQPTSDCRQSLQQSQKSYVKRTACQVEALEVAGEASENAGIGPILTQPKVPA
ncbi:hypothetical protein N0710_31410, partial [Pseudomonas aeruginosa]|nr:hypothetical protein [Pseudomonas aeruginosa]